MKNHKPRFTVIVACAFAVVSAVLSTAHANAADLSGSIKGSEKVVATTKSPGNLPSAFCSSGVWVDLTGPSNEHCMYGVGTDTTVTNWFTGMRSYVPNRIWFHQYPNGTGWADCYEGIRSWTISGRDQYPGNVFVSGNTAGC